VRINLSRLAGPFRNHFDKILAVLAILGLIATAFLLVVRIGAERQSQQARISGFSSLFSTNRVDLVTSADSVETRSRLKNPEAITISPDAASLLVPGKRVSCSQCRKPIPYDAIECAFCRYVAGVATSPALSTVDTDGDGMSNEWEVKYGLNPSDADDASEDPDGDGFSNIEEFKAGKLGGVSTDPKDPADVPPAWMYERLVVLKTDALQFKLVFKATTIAFDGSTNLCFNDKDSGRSYFLPVGTQVLDFAIIKYDELYTNVVSKTTGSNRVDISRATLRSKDGRIIELTRNVPLEQWDRTADIEYRPERRKFTVQVGDEFEVKKRKYRVKEIDCTSSEVVLFDFQFRKDAVIKKLTDDKGMLKHISQ